jgi:hypothetical protein
MAAAVIMDIAYGIQVRTSDDPYVKLAKDAVHGLSVATLPGRFLVVSSSNFKYSDALTKVVSFLQDTIPALKYVPSWVPGAGFQSEAKIWRKAARDLLEVPFAQAKRNIVCSA